MFSSDPSSSSTPASDPRRLSFLLPIRLKPFPLRPPASDPLRLSFLLPFRPMPFRPPFPFPFPTSSSLVLLSWELSLRWTLLKTPRLGAEKGKWGMPVAPPSASRFFPVDPSLPISPNDLHSHREGKIVSGRTPNRLQNQNFQCNWELHSTMKSIQIYLH